MIKRIIQIILFMSVLCLGILPVYANVTKGTEEIIVQPFWTEISQFNNSFNITSSGRADIESTLLAFDVDSIKIEANLQQFKNGSWVTIKSWKGTSSDILCMVKRSWYVLKGYGYRMVSAGIVCEEGRQVEIASFTSTIMWYD